MPDMFLTTELIDGFFGWRNGKSGVAAAAVSFKEWVVDPIL
jgi:hypothetical protein